MVWNELSKTFHWSKLSVLLPAHALETTLFIISVFWIDSDQRVYVLLSVFLEKMSIFLLGFKNISLKNLVIGKVTKMEAVLHPAFIIYPGYQRPAIELELAFSYERENNPTIPICENSICCSPDLSVSLQVISIVCNYVHNNP